MKTTLDITSILYELINVEAVKEVISGDVYRDQRPANSNVQDIVVSASTIDGDMIQEGVGYINIHIPGVMPDQAEFKSIIDKILPIVKSSYKRNEYSLRVTNILGPIKQDPNEHWYMSIRIRTRMYFNN